MADELNIDALLAELAAAREALDRATERLKAQQKKEAAEKEHSDKLLASLLAYNKP